MSSPRQAYLLRCSVEHLISAVDLVPRNEWRKVFRGPISRGRNCINDEQHADEFIAKYLGGEDGVRDKTVIEMLAGPGVLTKSLLKHGARHVIAIENEVAYTVALEDIRKKTNNHITVLPYHGENSFTRWDPNVDHLASLQKTDWEELRKDVLITGLYNIGRYQILSRFFQTILARTQMFSLGRTRAVLMGDVATAKQALASCGTTDCRPISYWASAAADVTMICEKVPNDMFFIQPKQPMSVLEIIPKIKSGLTAPVDILQHLLVLLFTKKRQPIRVAIKSVAPSAEELLDGVDIDPEIRPYDLNLKQLDELAIKFRDWKHRPATLETGLLQK